MSSRENSDDLFKHLDVFKEIGNIGAGHAASALAELLNRRITMSVPEATVIYFDDILNILDGPETPVAGILIDCAGDLNGHILLALSMHDAMSMVAQVLGEPVRNADDFNFELTAFEKDTLLEISNILVSSFLTALTDFSGLSAIPTVPQLAVDMLGAILNIVTVEYGMRGDSVLFLKTQFNDFNGDINGHFFLIPDYNSYKMLITALGLE